MSAERAEFLASRPESQGLEARCAALERAYDDLLERVRRYERERVEIRARLARILGRMGPGTPTAP